MRAVFGVVSLLIVLAVVGWTTRAAWRGGGAASSAAPAAASAAVAPSRQVVRDLDAALRQGQARNDDAERPNVVPADPADRPGAAGSAP